MSSCIFLNGAPFFSSLRDDVRRPPALTIGRLVSKPLAAKDEPQLARVIEGPDVLAVQQPAETSLPATCDLPDPTKVEPMRLPRTYGTAAFLPDGQGSEKSGQGQTGAEHVKSVRATLEASSLTCCTIGGSLCHRAGSAEVWEGESENGGTDEKGYLARKQRALLRVEPH